ncbi:TonB-dependent siderophore receptor [Chitinophaga lutea]|uniref:TonB-dependent siderophore receptor n=1 Tax=Chitinophaga lutea TaxID=2488634 RepID=A0A3N4QDD0_9BACT|nr:TonB-dependent receptor [Chitinophaga lutea]RPE09764.1 TonB-dependent siderophore receptor [Chitinophaga lutea]
MKRLIHLILLLLCAQGISAQNTSGVIKGTVRTSDGQPAPFVSVLLKNNNRGVVTDMKGEFSFRRLQPGAYTILVTLVGYEPLEKEVRVAGTETVNVPLQLTVSNLQLQEVTIKGTQPSKKESEYIARLPIKNIENPQVYNVVNKELMKEQMITTFDDAIKNAPGVSRLWSSTGRPGDGAGYFIVRGFSVQPTMIDGVAGLTNGGIDPANTERIEVIKGPSGTLFGSSLVSFGGLMNIVTKKPYDTFGGDITYTAGGFGLNRVTADINTPLDGEKKFLLRVNAAYHNEGSFQDAGFKKSFFFAPSFSYQASDRLSFHLNTEIYNAESTNTLMVFLNRNRQLIARTPAELGIDFNRSFTSNDISYKTPTTNLVGQIKYKLSDTWTSQTVAAHSIRKSDGYYSYVMFLDAADPKPNDSLLSRFVYTQNQQAITTNVQQNFIGDFKLGSLRNRVVVGVDFLNQQTTNNYSPYALFDIVSAVNARDPRYGQLTRPAVDAKLGSLTSGYTKNAATTYAYGAYISDVLNITKALSAMMSLRFDYFDNKGTKNHLTGALTGNYNQRAFSPKFGLVYQVVQDKVSLFANYMNGFRNITAAQPNPALGLDIKYKPQQANQLEGGVKVELLNNSINFTASYYDIKVTNMSRQVTAKGNDGVDYNYTIQDGVQRSKGFEADANVTPVTGLNLFAGYGYNDSKMVESAPNVKGRRPTSAGPQHVANFWLGYTTPGGSLQGLGAGFGGNYASENVTTNDLNTGIFTLPAYTVLNATVFYQAKSFRLAVKLDNIANKEYFGGWTTVEKQLPRRLSASAGFRF